MKKIIVGVVVGVFLVGISQARAADQFVNASLQMSRSTPSQGANWTIALEVYNQIPPGGTITIDPESTSGYAFDLPVLQISDFDVTVGGVEQNLASSPGGSESWGVSATSGTEGVIVFTNNGSDTIGSGTQVVIEIGTQASFGGSGVNMIINPAKESSSGTADIRDVVVTSFSGGNGLDIITFKVPIVESVQNTSSSAPDLTMWILPGDSNQFGSGVTVSSTAISWGQVIPGVPLTAQVEVGLTTNAQSGFTLSVHQESDDSQGRMINTENSSFVVDNFSADNVSPSSWVSPSGTTAGASTAYLGYHTSDTSLIDGVVSRFGSSGGSAGYQSDDLWAGLSLTPFPVLSHNGPVNEGACNFNGAGSCTANGTTELGFANIHPAESSSTSYAVATGDIDSDGDEDIFVAEYYAQNQLWINDGSGVFSDGNGRFTGLPTGDDSVSASMADFNKDGHLDIFVSNDTDTNNEIWLNDGSGNFTAGTVPDKGSIITSDEVVADFNGDGNVDVLQIAEAAHVNSIMLFNDGNANFTASNRAFDGQCPGKASCEVASGDFDKNGTIDLYIPTDSDGQNKLWFNDGSGNFSASGNVSGDANYDHAVARDLDSDGDLDIVAFNKDVLVWLDNNGSGSFTSRTIDGSLGFYYVDGGPLAVGDIDLDNDKDIYVPHFADIGFDGNVGQNILFLNDGSETFSRYEISGDVGRTDEVHMFDADNDGDLDLYATSHSGDAPGTSDNRLWRNDLVINGSPVNGRDYALVTFKLEASNLQPSGNYANSIVFTAKPVF